MEKIAIINLKGGVGKSVTTCNVSVLLAKATGGERSCLVIDLDKQANTTKFFNRLDYDHPAVDQVMLYPNTALSCIRDTDFPGVDLMPANMRLLSANRQVLIDCTQRQQDRLQRALAHPDIRDTYRWCLMDCPPDIDMTTINALCAADWVIIPVDCDEWALDGLREIVEQIEHVRDCFNPQLKIMGCLVTRYSRTKYASDIVTQLKRTGLPVFHNGIRQAVAVAQSKAKHLTVGQFASQSPAAGDYRRLTQEIVSIVDTSAAGTKEAYHG